MRRRPLQISDSDSSSESSSEEPIVRRRQLSTRIRSTTNSSVPIVRRGRQIRYRPPNTTKPHTFTQPPNYQRLSRSAKDNEAVFKVIPNLKTNYPRLPEKKSKIIKKINIAYVQSNLSPPDTSTTLSESLNNYLTYP